MRCPAELYTASTRTYDGLPELTYPFHDRDVLVTACGRLCLHRKKINISTVLAGQRLGNKRLGYPSRRAQNAPSPLRRQRNIRNSWRSTNYMIRDV
jgi:hypothetical protein